MDWLILVSGWVVGAIGWGMWIDNRLWLKRVDWVPRRPDVEPAGVMMGYVEPEEEAERQMMKIDRELLIRDVMHEQDWNWEHAEEHVDTLLTEHGFS